MPKPDPFAVNHQPKERYSLPEHRFTVFEGDAYELFQCYSCGLWESYINEFYRWPESGNIFAQKLYCWDCWERVSGKKLNRSAKPQRQGMNQ